MISVEEQMRLNDEVVNGLSELAKFLGAWFDKDGKLIKEIPHSRLDRIVHDVMGFAIQLERDDARRAYARWLEDQEVVKTLRRSIKNDETNEGV